MTQTILGALVFASLVGGIQHGQGMESQYRTNLGNLGTTDQWANATNEYLTATHYGESFNGQPMGCPGYGAYWSTEPSIVAVGPSRYREWPCGTALRVCARVGTMEQLGEWTSPELLLPVLQCVEVRRQDSCPGCGHYLIDLSEAGIAALGCIDVCSVTVEEIK